MKDVQELGPRAHAYRIGFLKMQGALVRAREELRRAQPDDADPAYRQGWDAALETLLVHLGKNGCYGAGDVPGPLVTADAGAAATPAP